MAKVGLVGVDNQPGNAAKIFAGLASAKVVVNDIMQTEVSEEKANLSFTINNSDLAAAKRAVEQIKDEVHCDSVFVRDDIAEISVVGVGMRTHYGVADKMFGALADAKVNIDSITTSEIRISCIVNKEQADKALEAVSAAFDTTSEIRISCIVNKEQADKALEAVSAAFELDKPGEERSGS
jgi:aspartate kinase